MDIYHPIVIHKIFPRNSRFHHHRSQAAEHFAAPGLLPTMIDKVSHGVSRGDAENHCTKRWESGSETMMSDDFWMKAAFLVDSNMEVDG